LSPGSHPGSFEGTCLVNRFPRLLMLGFDAPTRESIRDTLTPRGIRVVEALGDADVIVVGAPAAVSPEVAQAVVGGLGLVAVGAPEGLALLGATAHVTPTSVCTRAQAETAWPDEDLLARVDVSALTSHTAYAGEFTALLRAGANVVAAHGSCGDGRVVLLGASGSPALLEMAIFHAARRRTVESTGSSVAMDPAWLDLKNAVLELREMQIKDGSIPSVEHHARARALVTRIDSDLVSLAPTFAHDADYFAALSKDLDAWVAGGFGVPDFYDSIVAFAPAAERRDGMKHLVLFPMYTQNGSPDRLFEAVLIEVIWPEFIADLEGGRVLQQALPLDPVPRLHAWVRHALGRAVPRDGGDAGGAGVHVGGDLPRPRGCSLPPGARRGGSGDPLGASARRGADAHRPSTHRRDLRDVGPDPRPHPHAW
jgi:hypothetical protein